MFGATPRPCGRRHNPRIPTRSGVAMLTGLPLEKVRVIFTRGSGCYGINGADTVSFDAALLSQAVAKPVRIQLTRKDEMAWENYGLAYVIDQRIGLDAERHDRRVGLRRMAAVARWSSRLRRTGQRRHRFARRIRTGRCHATSGHTAERSASQRQQRRAFVHRRLYRRRAAAARERSRASASARTRSCRRSSRVHCARRRGCRTPLRTNASSTKLPRRQRPIRSRFGCVTCAMND